MPNCRAIKRIVILIIMKLSYFMRSYRRPHVSARLQDLQCWSTGDSAVLHCVFNKIADPLSYICYLSLTLGVFPDKLKIANVIPLFKKDNQMCFNNYRPFELFPWIVRPICLCLPLRTFFPNHQINPLCVKLFWRNLHQFVFYAIHQLGKLHGPKRVTTFWIGKKWK